MEKEYELDINKIINEITTNKYDQKVDSRDLIAISIIELAYQYCDFSGSKIMSISYEDLERAKEMIEDDTASNVNVDLKELTRAEHLKEIMKSIKNNRKVNKNDLF